MQERECLDVVEAIHSTPMRRYLKPDPIPKEVIWAILDAAIRGPTGGNSQGWAWYVVQDPDTRAEIARRYKETLLSLYGPERHPEEALRGARIVGMTIVPGAAVGVDSRNRAGVVHLAEHIHEAPALVIPVIRDRRTYGKSWAEGARAGSFIYGAIQNLMLAARAFGVGAPLTYTAGLMESTGVNELLGLPEHARGMAIVPLGYPARGRWAEPKRLPIEEVVFWNGWNARLERRQVAASDPART